VSSVCVPFIPVKEVYMPDNKNEVLLLKSFAEEAIVTRQEISEILGTTPGHVFGLHNRNLKEIGTWPTLNQARRANRGCQFPVGVSGTEEFDVCGESRDGHHLLCKKHQGKVWRAPQCAETETS